MYVCVFAEDYLNLYGSLDQLSHPLDMWISRMSLLVVNSGCRNLSMWRQWPGCEMFLYGIIIQKEGKRRGCE